MIAQNPILIQRMRELKQQGLTHREVAAQLGVRKDSLVKKLRPKGATRSKCQLCLSDRRTERHHFSYTPEIVLALCPRCHRQSHSKAEAHRTAMLTTTERDWLEVAAKVLAGEFPRPDRSTVRSLTTGLHGINHVLARRAISALTDASATIDASAVSDTTRLL